MSDKHVENSFHSKFSCNQDVSNFLSSDYDVFTTVNKCFFSGNTKTVSVNKALFLSLRKNLI